ncbi:hypothetical protein AAG747_04945 [Rapidithrix thailandica]|uniref:Uncharacterized protein n=1 Tax=Rapidithrix thailandica TaxID=413964 RepID=A0AAW9S4C6_9BACT
MNSDIVQYKYNVHTKSALFFKKAPSSLIIIVILGITLGLMTIKWFLGVIFLVIVLLVKSHYKGLKKGIILENQFMLIGDEIIYFSNIKKAVFDGKKKQLQLSINGKEHPLFIKSVQFTSGARKDFKIKKHQYNKLCKVSEKILVRIQKRSPKTIIKIQNESSLRKYQTQHFE